MTEDIKRHFNQACEWLSEHELTELNNVIGAYELYCMDSDSHTFDTDMYRPIVMTVFNIYTLIKISEDS